MSEIDLYSTNSSKIEKIIRIKILTLKEDELQSIDEYNIWLYKMFIKESKKIINEKHRDYVDLKVSTNIDDYLGIIEFSLEKLVKAEALSNKKANKLLEKLYSKKTEPA